MTHKSKTVTQRGEIRSFCAVCSFQLHVTPPIRQRRWEDLDKRHICASPLTAPLAASSFPASPSPRDAFQELRHPLRQCAQINSQVTSRREEESGEDEEAQQSKMRGGPRSVQTMFSTRVPWKKKKTTSHCSFSAGSTFSNVFRLFATRLRICLCCAAEIVF